jgi:hypothetical protein
LASIWNCTIPVGVPTPGAVTLIVAVKVTDCPDIEELAEETTAVPVLALATVWVNVPLLARKLPSPA